MCFYWLTPVLFRSFNYKQMLWSAEFLFFEHNHVRFTPLCSVLPPKAIVLMLGTLFSMCDALAEKHKIERLKTLGDAYIAVANITTPNVNHAEVILK